MSAHPSRASTPPVPGSYNVPARSAILRTFLNILVNTRNQYETTYGCVCRDVAHDIRQNQLHPTARVAESICELLTKKWRIRAVLDQLIDDTAVVEGLLRAAVRAEQGGGRG